ncbi:unnamed protein product [Cercopithifilaria johnstoni]|uniref:Moesin/ezrin/radixin homolog 1 n=1 Tax=Cercopithifilaria johnstoni TaxID=2874296 RepID=A0A8J2MAC9_9BILA|nr:unnamed protein product [Cercopithifilaria johnstoni]
MIERSLPISINGIRESEGEIDNIQQTMDQQQPATVKFLDSTKHIFYVSKKADGGELFDKVCAFLGLIEKDYFGLCFIDSDGNQQWIYEDKRISKQLKGNPWNFNFQVKFYPTEPATLAGDKTRHLLSLQVRQDISTGRLPATLATHALLGSYVAQSVLGDYEPSLQYIDFLRSCNLAPMPNETLYEKIEELHKHHKGETSAEADLHYLENAKKLSMYGVHLFNAKDGKGTPVQIGISAHGINIYLDQIRVHRFLWQNIIKIGYRRNVFMIKVKPGELEKNESTVAFKLSDYEGAKRVWKCGVEHHTFFRLIQPEEKPHKGLFRWSSTRFRYQGRTQFQSKMASQMFCNVRPVQRSQSVRLTANDRDVPVPVSTSQTLPLMYSESGTGRELEWDSSQMISPEKIYSKHVTEATQKRENNAMQNGAEVGNTNNTSGKPLHSIHSSVIFTTSVTTATTATNSAAITTTITPPTTTVTSTSPITEYFERPLSPHVSPRSIKITRDAGLTTHEFSDGGFHGYVSDNLSDSRPSISALRRGKNTEFFIVKDKAVVYHPGHYEEEVTGSHSRRFREPPVEPDDDFVLVHRPKLGSTGKIFHQNGAETDILIKEEDIETYPLRHVDDISRPDFLRSTSRNKDFKVFEHEKYLKTDDVADKPRKNIVQMVNKEKYLTNEKESILHTGRSMEPLGADAYVYNQGFYDARDPSRIDIDEKDNVQDWLRCYKKPEKSPTKLLKDKNAEIKEKNMVDESRFVDDQENKTKKIALIHVKQPRYEKQVVQTSYYNAESSEREPERTAYLKESKPVTSGIKANKSFGNDTKEEGYDYTQLKQTCHLFVGTSDSCRVRPGAYGMPSTSYGELLHNIKREKELPSLPIREYVTVYHSGMSVVKDRKHRKFLIRKEQQKATSSEASADEEMQTDKGKKWTAILDISGADKSDLTNGGDVEKRPVNEEIRRKYMTQNMKEKEYLDQMKPDRTVDSKMQKSTQNVKSEGAHQKMKAVLHFDEGHSSNTKKGTFLKKADESKNEHTIRPIFSVSGIGKSVEKSKKAELPEQSCSVHILDNTPPSANLSRVNEISFQPLHLSMEIQNQIQNVSRNYRTFKRAKHKGTVEFVGKENINPESYKLECTPYEGPLEITNFAKELHFAPIHKYSAVYHHGNTYVKSRKIDKRKNAEDIQNEKKPGILGAKSTAVLYLNENNFDAEHHEEEKNNSEAFLTKNKDQGTMYSAKIAYKIPRRKPKKHPFKYRTVSGDIEIVEKSFVKPETYNLISVPYDGPLSCLQYAKELSFTPLRECTAAYHSGISQKKTRFHDSSTESSSNSSFSSNSSSSSSSAFISKKHEERKKKAILYVTSNNERDTTDVITESPIRKGIFTFWRKAVHAEKGGFSDDKKDKLEASPKPHLIQQQLELPSDFIASQATSSSPQIISTVLVKNSVEEPRNNLHVKSENKKMSANLYVRNEPSTASGKDNGKHGKFNLLHFWRSTDKGNKLNSEIADMNNSEEPLNHTFNFDSSREKTNVQLTTKAKKEPIIYVINKDESELTRSVDMKEGSLNHSPVSLPSQNSKANMETKKNAIIYLERNTDFSDGATLNLNGSPGIFRQENAAVAMNEISSHTLPKNNESVKLGSTEKSHLVDRNSTRLPENVNDSIGSTLKKRDKSDGIGYIARIKIKHKMRNAGNDLQQDSDLKAKHTNASDDDISKKSTLVVKGFHLRGPPCDLKPKIAVHSSTKYEPEKDAHITEVLETGEVMITERKEADFPDSADKLMPCEKLKVKKSTEGGIILKENKKDSGKSTRGSFFSSLWRGSKLKSNDKDEHQKQKKLTEKNIYAAESGVVGTISPTNELKYNIPRTKVILDSDKPLSNVNKVEWQTRQGFIPVYDFSYVPNFPILLDDTEVAAKTVADDLIKQVKLGGKDDSIITEIINKAGEQKESELKQRFNRRLKDKEECSDMFVSSEDQNESWKQEQSAVMGERALMEKAPEIVGSGRLLHGSGISGGETSHEPYIFTQTPPDIPVLVAHDTDSKNPGGFVEQINRQVTQVITKTSPPSDIRKKLKKEKKSKIGASPRENECSNAESDVSSHYDSSFNQKRENKPEVTGGLPSDEAKLDDQRMLLKELKKEMYDPMNVEPVPAAHLADVDGSLHHTSIKSWQETINGPEEVVTSIDHQGNITKKRIMTSHTVQQHTYQTSNASGQNGDSELNVIEITEESLNKSVVSFQRPVAETMVDKVTHEPTSGLDEINGNDYSDIQGELVSSRTVTQGNRTIETITYKTEKNGTVETHVEHRVTIHSCDDIDHDAELSQAILEATNMNPDMTVEKIEVKHESQC